MHVHEQWRPHCTCPWGWQTPLSEHVYCVAVTVKMTEQGEQQICIKFCVKTEHSCMETTQMSRKPQLWATGDWQLHHDNTPLMHHISYRVFGKTSNHPGDSAPLQPRFGALQLLAFPKTKITFEREEISDCPWDSGKYNRADDGEWENWVRSEGVSFEADYSIIVLGTIFLLSCIFFNKCLYFSYYMAGYLLDRLGSQWYCNNSGASSTLKISGGHSVKYMII